MQPGTFLLGQFRSGGEPVLRTPRAGASRSRSRTREAYSHEVISAGFWPGGGEVKGPAFYSYTAPAPAGIEKNRYAPKRFLSSEAFGIHPHV